MDYRITKATPEIGQIEVTYTYNGRALATYAIDVPIVEGAFITGDALESEIQHRAPTWLVEREQAIATAAGFEQITARVQEFPVAPQELDPEAIANAQMWEQIQFEKRVAQALVKFELLAEDPTAIPSASL